MSPRHAGLRRVPSAVLLACMAATAAAWSPPLTVSAPAGSTEVSTPRLAAASDGRIYLVYIEKSSPWKIRFRERSAAGHWGSVQLLSSAFAVRPDVIAGPDGEPHVLYVMANGPDAYYDLIHARRINGVWTSQVVQQTDGLIEDEPRLARDSSGNLHAIYTSGTNESSSAGVAYRVWNGVAWSAPFTVGNVDNAYYHRPDIVVDANDVAHVTWIDRSGADYRIRYRSNSAGAWSSTPILAAGGGFYAYPRIGAATPSQLVIVWHLTRDASPKSSINFVASTDGGANWTSPLIVQEGHYPMLKSAGGAVHMICQRAPASNVLDYRSWTSGGWSSASVAAPTDGFWKGWPDLAVDASNARHVAFDYGTSPNSIQYVTTAGAVPPPQVANVQATPASGRVTLTWTNPPDPTFTGTMIRVSTAGPPLHPAEGTLLADRAAEPGSSDSFVHAPLINGTTYYYALFSHEVTPLYAAPVQVAVRPVVAPDLDGDTDVDLRDFGILQACLAGSMASVPSGCDDADFNGDLHVDAADLSWFLACLSGEGIPFIPDCEP